MYFMIHVCHQGVIQLKLLGKGGGVEKWQHLGDLFTMKFTEVCCIVGSNYYSLFIFKVAGAGR